MIRPRATVCVWFISVAMLPLVLYWGSRNDFIDAGLIWLFLYNVYYAPVSWIGAPFFRSAAEIGVVVPWPGYLFTVALYSGVIYAIFRSRARQRARRISSPDGGKP